MKILMIEDDSILSNLLGEALKKDGYEVVSAMDGASGRRLVEKENPDLVLVDYILPGISGPDLVGQLKNDPRLSSIPIIVLSNVGNKEEIKRVEGLGVKKYLVKYNVTLREILGEIKKTSVSVGGSP